MVTASHADATTPGLLAAATATTIFVRGHISVFIVSTAQCYLKSTIALLHAALRPRTSRCVIFGVSLRRRSLAASLSRNADAALQRASYAAVRSAARMAVVCLFLSQGLLSFILFVTSCCRTRMYLHVAVYHTSSKLLRSWYGVVCNG